VGFVAAAEIKIHAGFGQSFVNRDKKFRNRDRFPVNLNSCDHYQSHETGETFHQTFIIPITCNSRCILQDLLSIKAYSTHSAKRENNQHQNFIIILKPPCSGLRRFAFIRTFAPFVANALQCIGQVFLDPSILTIVITCRRHTRMSERRPHFNIHLHTKSQY
jgi:hypothetical protein